MHHDRHAVKKLMTTNGGRDHLRRQLNSYEKLEGFIVANNQAISIGSGQDFRFRRRGNLDSWGNLISPCVRT